MGTCRWNPGSTEADRHLAMDFSTMKRSHLLHFLLCCSVVFNVSKSRGPCQINRVHWSEKNLVWMYQQSLVKEQLNFTPRNLTGAILEYHHPALHLRFQGWLLCFSVASMTRFLWKFCLSAFGLSLETIFGSSQNIPEVPFTSALVQRL